MQHVREDATGNETIRRAALLQTTHLSIEAARLSSATRLPAHDPMRIRGMIKHNKLIRHQNRQRGGGACSTQRWHAHLGDTEDKSMDVRHLVRCGGWGQEHVIAHRTETVNCQLSKSLFLVLEAGVAETMPQAS